MRCRQCGGENLERARYCRFCGAELAYKGGGKKQNKKSLVIRVSLICLAFVFCAVGITSFTLSKKTEKQLKANLSKGNKFLEDMDYKQAEDQYLKAIEIDKKDPETYLKLAEVYVKQNEPEKAKKILEQGKKETNSKKLVTQYNLYTYVDDVLIPELGQCEEGTYTCNYITTNYGMTLESVHSQTGVLTSRIQDFDGDGQEELLVLVMKNNEKVKSEEGLDEPDRNAVYLQMYEVKNQNITLQAEMKGLGAQVLGFGDNESDGIFLKKYNEKTYICGSTYGLAYLWADGSSFNSFVVTYEDGEFCKYCGTEDTIGGSDFRDYEAEANEMASALEQIDLKQEAEQIRASGMQKFDFIDEVDDMLMRVVGEYDWVKDPSHYWESDDINDFSQVRIKLKLSWNPKDEKRSGEELYQNVLSAYLSGYQSDFLSVNPYYIRNEEDLADRAEGKLTLFYALEDMNGDGIEELFIGEQTNTDDIDIIDTWKYSIDQPDRIIPDVDMGIVNTCTPCEGGIYQVWIWHTSFQKSFRYYSISEDGIGYKKLEEVTEVIDNSDIYEPHPTGREETTYYYSSPSSMESEITEEQFEEVQSKYKAISLNWKPLEQWEQTTNHD